MHRKFFYLIALALSVPAYAGTFRHDRSNIQHIELAQDPRYQSVGLFEWEEEFFPGLSGGASASGVLISPEWVLTAGHVVGGNDNAGGGINDLQFTIDGIEDPIPAAEWIPHESWTATSGDLSVGYDVALVRLSRLVFNVEPATLYSGDDELGRVGTIVGYGLTGTGLTGEGFLDEEPTKRAGHNVIDGVGRELTVGSDPFFAYDNERLISADFDSPTDPNLSSLGSTEPLDLEFSDARGDSGGGVFIEIDGRTQVAGIVSFGVNDGFDLTGPIADYGDVSAYTRVSAFIDWIEDQTGLVLDNEPLGAEFGDFDGDGFVTTEDYNRWVSEFGRSVGVLTADANRDGTVNGVDYSIWRDAFAQSQAVGLSAVAVPEPSGFALLAAAAALASCRRRAAGRAMVR